MKKNIRLVTSNFCFWTYAVIVDAFAVRVHLALLNKTKLIKWGMDRIQMHDKVML